MVHIVPVFGVFLFSSFLFGVLLYASGLVVFFPFVLALHLLTHTSAVIIPAS